MIRVIYTFICKHAFVIILLLIFIFRLISICNNLSVYKECSSKRIGENKYEVGLAGNIRNSIANNVRSVMPSPYSELALGMTLGLDDFKKLPTFNDVLVRSGTIHVVVVSGYNLNLIFTYMLKVFENNLRFSTLLLTQIFAVIYAGISGFEPPVVRALFMVSIVTWGYFIGRKVDIMQAFLFSASLMLAINPLYIYSLSFQLSALASLGLLLYSPILSGLLNMKNILTISLIETISAQLLVWPLIAYTFSTVSLISPLTNMLTLWLVPLITISSFVIIVFSYISHPITQLLVLIQLPFSYFFVMTNALLVNVRWSSIPISLSRWFLVTYYMVMYIILCLTRRIRVSDLLKTVLIRYS